MLLSLLPVLAWGSVFFLFKKKTADPRVSFLYASVIWGLMVAASTEFLGLFRLLEFVPLLTMWGLLGLAAFRVALNAREAGGRSAPGRPDFSLKALLAGIAAIAALTGVVAALAPPNNWDSMTYHMSRVMHWMQNRSVGHYPTHITRQIELNPWAEYAILHFQILGKGDHLANFVQWFAMAGSIIGVSAIAKRMGAAVTGQASAAFIAATIPMGILQSTSTQNDYAAAFWLVCFVYFGLAFRQRPAWPPALLAGAGLGLAILTKGTSYIFAFPFAVWFALAAIKGLRLRSVKFIGAIILIVLAVNAGHYARNFNTFGNPLVGDSGLYANQSHTAASMASNLVRNAALHLGTPWKAVNKVSNNLVRKFHTLSGADIDDPAVTFPSTTFNIDKTSRHEDSQGNPLHLVLVLFALSLFAVSRKFRQTPFLTPYTWALIAGFVLFCAYLRWQPWHSRLHLPLFVLWSPVMAAALSAVNKQAVRNAALAILFLASVPFLFGNLSRPLLGRKSVLSANRTEVYFYNRPPLKAPYLNAASLLSASGCGDIALRAGGDDWEYPLWVLLQAQGANPRIKHIDVKNPSGELEAAGFRPCAVISTNNNEQGPVVQLTVDLTRSQPHPRYKVTGMGEPEGPYAQWGLPEVRWAKKDRVHIEFDGAGGGMAELRMSFKPFVRESARMAVLFNGKLIRKYEATDDWKDDALVLSLVNGINSVELVSELKPGEPPPENSLYMLFRELSITAAPEPPGGASN